VLLTASAGKDDPPLPHHELQGRRQVAGDLVQICYLHSPLSQRRRQTMPFGYYRQQSLRKIPGHLNSLIYQPDDLRGGKFTGGACPGQFSDGRSTCSIFTTSTVVFAGSSFNPNCCCRASENTSMAAGTVIQKHFVTVEDLLSHCPNNTRTSPP
jgi:hypothetical protein